MLRRYGNGTLETVIDGRTDGILVFYVKEQNFVMDN